MQFKMYGTIMKGGLKEKSRLSQDEHRTAKVFIHEASSLGRLHSCVHDFVHFIIYKF